MGTDDVMTPPDDRRVPRLLSILLRAGPADNVAGYLRDRSGVALGASSSRRDACGNRCACGDAPLENPIARFDPPFSDEVPHETDEGWALYVPLRISSQNSVKDGAVNTSWTEHKTCSPREVSLLTIARPFGYWALRSSACPDGTQWYPTFNRDRATRHESGLRTASVR